jgi:hypothetical protein
MAKFNNAARGSFRGIIWLLVLGVALSISAYSLYFVARSLGVPKIFAAGFSTAYDGVALIAADKALQFAQEGKSGAFPRMVMIVFAGLSAFLNSLHAIFGHESPLAIPIWAGLPLAAVAAFEIHTSQARSKAHARFGYAYPAPVPKYGGWDWCLFPLATLSGLRNIVSARGKAVTTTNRALAAVNERRTAASRPIERPERPALAERTTQPVNDAAGTNDQADTGTEGTTEGTTSQAQPARERTPRQPRQPAGTVIPLGRARHAPERHIRDWAKERGYKVAERGALPQWLKDEYASERSNDEAANDA